MIYESMRKLIENQQRRRANGTITEEQYAAWGQRTKNKLGLLLIGDSLTEAQYKELVGMFAAEEQEAGPAVAQ